MSLSIALQHTDPLSQGPARIKTTLTQVHHQFLDSNGHFRTRVVMACQSDLVVNGKIVSRKFIDPCHFSTPSIFQRDVISPALRPLPAPAVKTVLPFATPVLYLVPQGSGGGVSHQLVDRIIQLVGDAITVIGEFERSAINNSAINKQELPVIHSESVPVSRSDLSRAEINILLSRIIGSLNLASLDDLHMMLECLARQGAALPLSRKEGAVFDSEGLQSVSELNEYYLLVSDPDDMPVVSDPDDMPVVSDPDDMPVVSDPDDMPVVSDPDDMPVVSDPDDMPVVSDPDDMPVVSDPDDMPVVSDPDDMPVVSDPDDMPVVSDPDDMPVASDPDDMPVASDPDDMPVASDPDDMPEQKNHRSDELKPTMSGACVLDSDTGHNSGQGKVASAYIDAPSHDLECVGSVPLRDMANQTGHTGMGHRVSVNNNTAMQMISGMTVSVLNQASNTIASTLPVVIPPQVVEGQKQLPPIILPNINPGNRFDSRKRKSKKELKEEEEREREGEGEFLMFDDEPLEYFDED